MVHTVSSALLLSLFFRFSLLLSFSPLLYFFSLLALQPSEMRTLAGPLFLLSATLALVGTLAAAAPIGVAMPEGPAPAASRMYWGTAGRMKHELTTKPAWGTAARTGWGTTTKINLLDSDGGGIRVDGQPAPRRGSALPWQGGQARGQANRRSSSQTNSRGGVGDRVSGRRADVRADARADALGSRQIAGDYGALRQPRVANKRGGRGQSQARMQAVQARRGRGKVPLPPTKQP